MACTGDYGGLYIDDKLIDELYIDDQRMDYLEIDGKCIYRRAAPPGQVIFDVPGNYTWVIPFGYDSVYVCMVGGGGSGGQHKDSPDMPSRGGGGYAGKEYSGDVAVISESTVNITVGAGGASVNCGGGGNACGVIGNPGGVSLFHTVTVQGGAGGGASNTSEPDYRGNGGNGPDGCGGGGYKDGLYYRSTTPGVAWASYGGQASSFGSGSNGTTSNSGNPNIAGVGAGGGGNASNDEISSGGSGVGGRGEVRVSWGNIAHRKYRVYKLSEMTQEEKDQLQIKEI